MGTTHVNLRWNQTIQSMGGKKIRVSDIDDALKKIAYTISLVYPDQAP